VNRFWVQRVRGGPSPDDPSGFLIHRPVRSAQESRLSRTRFPRKGPLKRERQVLDVKALLPQPEMQNADHPWPAFRAANGSTQGKRVGSLLLTQSSPRQTRGEQ
jgi:hypothetical protein